MNLEPHAAFDAHVPVAMLDQLWQDRIALVRPQYIRVEKPVYDFAPLGRAIYLCACAALISRFKPIGKGKPPRELWMALVYTESAWGHISPVTVFARDRRREPARVRFRAWRACRLFGYSLPGIGAISGYDHTSVLSGIRRLAREDAEQ